MPEYTPNLESAATIHKDGSRRFIHPADVKGRFTRCRSLAGLLLMALYIALPWIPINGNPAVFFDLANRQFHLFGLTFVTQDLWLAFFVISGVGFALFYVAALFGRVWCGWGCPQTVFLDLARRLERWAEGDACKRRQLDQSRWTLQKTLRRSFKHVLLLGTALLFAHFLLAYFVSLPGLYAMMRNAPAEHWSAFLFVFFTAGALWFNLAWFREQFCIVLCPYGRLQSALIDSHSLVIGYDSRRGEPRGSKRAAPAGDCVDCRRCVQVCPTGIDIRQGLQMECIGCAACVDACDAVMDKLKRPRGLVRYASMNALAGKTTRWLRPRIILYSGLMILGTIALSLGLSTLQPATVSVVRMTGAPYILSEGVLRNQFILRIFNKRNRVETFYVKFLQSPQAFSHSGVEEPIEVAPLGEQMRPLIISLPRQDFQTDLPLRILVTSSDARTSIEKLVPFAGPISYGQ